MPSVLASKWSKVVLFVLCLGPLGNLGWRAFEGRLTANPIEFITHETGDWILIFLLATLSITPARKLLGQPQLIRFRRMLGLFAFFYACLHFLTYTILDNFFDWSAMIEDVMKRKFITLGVTGFVLLIPLAVTSTAAWIRRLGGRRWQRLHRLVYLSATAGVVHYYWLVKSDVTKPVRYGAVLAFLLVCRLAIGLSKRKAQPLRYAENLTPTCRS